MQFICKKTRLKLIIVGTAVSGKSKLSLSIAKHFRWQIINTDPGCFYRSADILTNKVTRADRSEVNHFCVDFLDLENRAYQMRQFEARVNRIVDREFAQNKGVLLVGGSNFYNEKVIFQQRSRILQEEKRDFYERLKHNINLFLNEIFFDENLKKISENLDLDLHFQKLLQRETEIKHSSLQTDQNKLKYLLLNAPQKVLDALFDQFDSSLILGLVKKLFPFSGSTINAGDKPRIRHTLLKFISGKPNLLDRPSDPPKVLETLNKNAEEEMLVVILYNSDTAFAQRLIRRRVAKMIFEKEGIKEFFGIFEKLLIRPESIFNIIEKYLTNLRGLECSLDEMILISLNDVKDSIKINKANRYGVLNVKGYKQFFNFFEKFIFILINNFFRITIKNKDKMRSYGRGGFKAKFVKYYRHLRDSLIKDLRSSLPQIFKQHGQVNEGDSNYLIKRVFLESLYNLEKEHFMLYKKQRTWLDNRIVDNNLLKGHIWVKEVKDIQLTDKRFKLEVIEPVIRRINQILGREGDSPPSAKPKAKRASNDPTNKPSDSNSPAEFDNLKENLHKRNLTSTEAPKTEERPNFECHLSLKRVKQKI